MWDTTGEADKDALGLDFDRRLLLQFRGSVGFIVTNLARPAERVVGPEGMERADTQENSHR
jgi:hypothetical protein